MNETRALPQRTHDDLSLSILPGPMHPAFKPYGGTIQATCAATIQNDTGEPLDTIPLLLRKEIGEEAYWKRLND